MTPNEHRLEWHRHDAAAEKQLEIAERVLSIQLAANHIARAQVHATLAHTHAFLMVEALK